MRSSAWLLILLFGFAAPASAADSPDWSAESIDGSIVSLGETASKQPTILLFWASWCPYCKALMPHLQSIELEYGDDVEILAIHFRDEKDPAAFIEDAGYDFTVIPNGEDIARLYGIWATPGVLIVDGDLAIRFDLRNLPPRPLPAGAEEAGHGRKAAHRAPWWAAAIRYSLDRVIAGGD